MTIQMRRLGIVVLIAIALALILVSGIHAAQLVAHAHAVSAASGLAINCPSVDTHC